MMSADSSCLKIMVSGDLHGKIDQLYARVDKLKKKGQAFDILFCVGDFFGEDDSALANYRNGRKKAPIQTYILGPNDPKYYQQYDVGDIDDGFEFCENIIYLGKKGVFKTSSGLRVAYISGIESPSGSTPSPKHCFSQTDTKNLLNLLKVDSSDYKGVDILLTSQWPKGVTNYANQPPETSKCLSCGSLLLSKFVDKARPRYHFAAMEGVYYERAPYRNHMVLKEQIRHITRFLSLAPLGNKDKQKYLYAFTIKPMCTMLPCEINKQPEDTTENPFRKIIDQQQSIPVITSDQFRWGVHQSRANKRRHGNYDQNGVEKKAPRPQDWSCWFCLGGDKVEKHLVASVGNLCYLAAAKGQLVPGHMLICPIAHHGSSLELPEDTAEEVKRYKQALKAAFAANDQHCVIFERNYKSDHLQIQVVPIPQAIASDAIKESIIDCASGQKDRNNRPVNIDFAELPARTNLKQVVSVGVPFFHIELPDGQRLFHKIGRYFPLQFGRESLAVPTVLNVLHRVDWRKCSPENQDTTEKETKCTTEFRQFFQTYDFTLQEDDDLSD